MKYILIIQKPLIKNFDLDTWKFSKKRSLRILNNTKNRNLYEIIIKDKNWGEFQCLSNHPIL